MASATINFEVKYSLYFRLVRLAFKLFGEKAWKIAAKMFKNKVAAKIYSEEKNLIGTITINQLLNKIRIA